MNSLAGIASRAISKRLFLMAIFLCISTVTIASTLTINGTSIATTVPPDHCELSNHPRDVSFIERYIATQAKGARLVSIFVLCDELIKFRKEQIDSFHQYGIIQQFSTIPGGNRRDYITYMSGEGAPAIAEGFKVGSERYTKYVGPIGDAKLLGVVAVDASAAYLGTLMTTADASNKPVTVIAVSGVTFIKQMTFAIHYAQQYSGIPPLPSLIDLQKRNLARFVSANER